MATMSLRGTALTLLVPLVAVVSLVAVGGASQSAIRARADGTLVLEVARDRNITLRLASRDSAFCVNNVSMLSAIKQRLAARRPHGAAAGARAEQLDEESIADGIVTVSREVRRLRRGIRSLFDRSRLLANPRIRRYPRRVNLLLERVTQMTAQLGRSSCDSDPCTNGGTCYNTYTGFHCECTDGWTGKTCEEDVDECYILAGTDLGCQNGGVCVNTLGSYRCACRNGFAGTHCRARNAVCDQQQQPAELCEHGTCVHANNEQGYTCICDQGWTKNNVTPACSYDVNECDEDTNPCHSNCLNLPGGFRCGPCPTGHTGDGITCHDIDECATNNGGCSLRPKVKCINTVGSYHCGYCPTGWIGDGRTCQVAPSNSCDSEGICHPLAKCEYISEAAVCTCPPGMYGHGFGANGCTAQATSDPCENHECKNNGTCVVLSRGTRCICRRGYMGPVCEQADACQAAPCLNGGTCLLQPNRKFRCTCPRGVTGLRCEFLRATCGTTIRQPSGELTYPPDGGSYAANERCAWIIRTNESLVLNVTFSRFDVEATPECSKDWLQIQDGRTLASQMIGRFCGAELPRAGTILSSHEQLFFWFHSDNTTNGGGFKLAWSSQAQLCGGTFELGENDHGVIQSPGYPGKAPSNRECQWELNAPFGYRLVLRFFAVTLAGGNTTSNKLMIYDSDVLLRTISDSSIPEPLHTSSNEVVVYFATDRFPAHSSFQLHYEVAHGTPHCGGLFTEPQGIITGYMDADVCLYLIQQMPGTRIKLEFLTFQLLESHNCTLQKLEIFDGRTDDDPLIKRLCGQQDALEPVTSEGNVILLRYKYALNGLRLSKFFQVKYSRVCGEKLFGPDAGEFSTPNYPNAYFDHITCTYDLYGPHDTVVHINITDFAISESSPMAPLAAPDDDPNNANKTMLVDDAHLNYVDVYLSKTKKFRYYSGKSPLHLVSENNRMRMVIHLTENTRKARGLSVQYSFKRERCGGVFTADRGVLTVNHHEKTFCEWVVEAPEGKAIYLYLQLFHFEETCDTGEHYLNVYSNSSDGAGQLLQSFRSTFEFEETLDTNLVTVIFKPCPGMLVYFYGVYKIVDSNKECGGVSTSRYGIIKSPSWPRPYGAGLNCTWIITAPLGQKLELVVRNFSLEATTDNCWNDYLTIRNGPADDSPLIGTYCGENIPARIPSFTNNLYLHFKTDNFLSAGGFYMTWEQTETGCGGRLSSHEGSIHAPHANTIAGAIVCDWQIVVSQGSRIVITLTKEDLTTNLYIYDGRTPLSPVLPLGLEQDTSTQWQTTLTTSGNQALVVYEAASELGKFFLTYRTECDEEITGLEGVIESPNFPENYPPGLHCKWSIRTGRNNKITLAFSHLNIAQRDQLTDYDYLELQDMRDEELLSKRRLHTTLPDVLVSEGNRLVLLFVTDYAATRGGFRAEYKIVGCGEHLRSDKGVIATPNAPYSVDVDCDWYIEVPAGNRIQLMFTELQMESDANDCLRDAITVAEDNSPNTTLWTKCQGSASTEIINSPGNRLYIHFRTSDTRARKYFRANYKAVSSTCGGLTRTSSGLITTPNYPDKLARDVRCEWSIMMERSYGMSISFDDFNLTDSAGCTDAFLQLTTYRDDKVQSEERACGTQRPLLSRVHGSVIGVTFAAKGNGWGKFQMRFEKQCGGPLLDAYGYMSSDFAESCAWLVNATEGNEISVDILHLECDCARTDTNCSAGLVFYNGMDGNRLQSICHDPPANIVLPVNALRIETAHVNFRGKYTTLQSACGGTITSLRGTLTSPSYPNSYPAGVECIWQVHASRGTAITMSLLAVDIATSEHCNGDFLELREGSAAGRLLGLYCGHVLPTEELLAYERVWIKFRSIAGSTGDGFKLRWGFAHNNEVNGTSGVIEAPPFYKFRNEEEPFTWRILGPRGHLITLDFEEYNRGLKLFDGYDETALPIDIVDSPWRFTSSGNVVYLATDNAELEQFRIRWQLLTTALAEANQTLNSCNKTVTVARIPNVNISSPGYPHGYADGLDCEWTVLPEDPTEHVYLQLYEAKLEDVRDCSADHLTVLTSSNLKDWREELRVCKSDDMSVKPLWEVHGTPYLKLKFRTDGSINGTGFTSLARALCGSNMTAPVGTILGSTVMTPPLRSNCLWHIEVRPGRLIEFDFQFKGDGDGDTVGKGKGKGKADADCTKYAIIYDGLDEHATIMPPGRICNHADHYVSVMRTTSNHAVVKYSLDWSPPYLPGGLWNLTYREYSDCNSDIRLTYLANSVNVSSPRYPNIPQPHTECTWIVVGPVGATLHANFVDRFSMNWNYCNKEFVELYDGSTTLARSLGRYCVRPDTVRTTGNTLYIRYINDVAEPRIGFRLNVSLASCGGTYNEIVGQITSANYPNPYAREVCEYYIKIPKSSGIHMTFADIHLPFDANNMNNSDYIEVVQLDANRTKLATVYGNATAGLSLDADANELLIRFNALQLNRNYRGFSLTYTRRSSMCYKDFFGESGMLTMTNQTALYAVCQWKITVPKGQRVKLEFLQVEDQAAHDNRTQRQQVFISCYNDANRNAKIIDMKRGDLNVGTVIQSTDNFMLVRITLGFNRFQLSKLQARYTSEEPSPCPADIGLLWSGSINTNQLRAYDKYYCSVKFTLHDKETIKFEIKSMEVTPSNSTTSTRAPISFSYGDARIRDPDTNTTKLVVSSKSGSLTLLQNFKDEIRQFSAIYRRYACGGLYNAGDGFTIDYPQLEEGQIGFDGELDCVWTLRGVYRMKLYKLTGYVSFSAACDQEYIALYMGPRGDSLRICRDKPYLNDTVLNVNTKIHYHTAAYRAGHSNFSFALESTMVCGEKKWVEGGVPHVVVDSSRYKNNMECSWEYNAAVGFRLSVAFTDRFFIENSANCTNDQLAVERYTDGLWLPEARFCGRELPPVFNSTSNRIRLIFRTNDAITGDGFTFQVAAYCNYVVNVTAEPQSLTTPLFRMLRNIKCQYTLQSSANTLFTVQLRNLETRSIFMRRLPMQRFCQWNAVTVFRKNVFGDLFEAGRYCEAVELSAEQYLRLDVVANLGQQFQFEFRLNTCGGNVTGPTTLRPQQNEELDTYAHDMNCVWYISAPPDHSVVIRFDYLEMEENCYDYVAVYGGRAIRQEKLIRKMCGKLEADKEQATVMVDSNQAVVVAVSDSSIARRGFQASVIFTRNCNEHIALTDGNSPATLNRHFEVNGTEELICHYNVMAPDGHRVSVLLKEMQLSTPLCRNLLSCSGKCNSIEVFDSAADDKPTMAKYCVDGQPAARLLSSYNDALVKFHAVQPGRYSFEIVLQMQQDNCGPLTDIDLQKGQVVTLSYPPQPTNSHNGSLAADKYPPNMHCTWRIRSAAEMELQFKSVLLQNASQVTGECLDYIHIQGLMMKKYFCGNATGFSVYAHKYEMAYVELTFHSDATIEDKGFTIVVSERRACNRTYTELSGVIEYSNFYSPSYECTDEIRVPADYSLTLHISSVVFTRTGCAKDHFKIVDISKTTRQNSTQNNNNNNNSSSSSNDPVLLHRCTNQFYDSSLFTAANAVRVYANYYSLVKFFYVASSNHLPPGCGGDIYSYEGQISNPSYTNDHRPSNCRWNIVVPEPNRLQLEFNAFDMGSKANCHLDNLSIVERQMDGSERVVRTYCGSDTPEVYTTTTSAVSIVAKKSPNFDGIGWTLAFQLDQSTIPVDDARMERFMNGTAALH